MAFNPKSLANLRPVKKGERLNPSGKPKVPQEVRDMFRGMTKEAAQALYDVVRDKRATAASRVSAATVILDRAWGKPEQNHMLKAELDVSGELSYVRTELLAQALLLIADNERGAEEGDTKLVN